MIPISFGRPRGKRLELLCVGAHCDDIEIGCGATLLAIQRQFPACRIHWLVLTSGTLRRKEELAAAAAFVAPRARGVVRIGDLPDGLLPSCLVQVKAEFEELKSSVSPDLILTHHESDRHQDHRLVNEVTWQTFRDHLILEYEIPKYDGDLTTPNIYVPLPAALATRKIAVITRVFRSQQHKSWFTAANLEAAMRLRGLESRSASGFAEAFHCRKLILDQGSTIRRAVSRGGGRRSSR